MAETYREMLKAFSAAKWPADGRAAHLRLDTVETTIEKILAKLLENEPEKTEDVPVDEPAKKRTW